MESKLITLAKQHEVKIKALQDERAKKKNKFHDEKYKIDKEFYAAERKARDIQNKKLAMIKNQEENIEKDYSERIDFLHIPIAALDRILEFKDIEKKSLSFDFSVYYFDYPQDENGRSDYNKDRIKCYYNPLAVLKDSPHIICNAFITDNEKPKNKYDLIIAGKSRFNEDIIKLPYCYGIDANTDNANIIAYINSFPSKKEAENYYKRNKHKILKDFFKEHQKAESEYGKVRDECKDKIWEIALLEKKKFYYEHNYSNGTEEKAYKEICKQLEELKSN